MTAIYSSLLSALEAQRVGSSVAADEIRLIAALVCGPQVFRDDELTPQQVSAIERLLIEWKDMFSFSPGRIDALPCLIGTLKVIERKQNITDTDLRETDGWRHLMTLRGPGADVVTRKCANCKREYTALYFGSFAENGGLTENYRVCDSCGKVVLCGSRVVEFAAACNCGGRLCSACPHCGSDKSTTVTSMSPYQYFASHAISYPDES